MLSLDQIWTTFIEGKYGSVCDVRRRHVVNVKQKIKINLKSKQKSFFCVCRNEIKKLSATWTGDGPAPGGQKAREKFADDRK